MADRTEPRWKPPKGAVYALRFHILPTDDDVVRAHELAAFSTAHRIAEVHLFIAPEEWNDGLMDHAQIDRYIASQRRIIPILRQAGLGVSLNLWCTTLHLDRGRRFKPEHPFQPMVSPTGRTAKAVASFACPNWQRYVAGLYRQFAALGYDVIWIEDDFRYHNHDPLDWGGTFDPLMLERFSNRIGRQVDRAELVRAILRPGPPHPWRSEWMATWFECQLEAARSIRDSVKTTCPTSTLGLMSSTPEAHSVEGRVWPAIWDAMRIDGGAWHRPHFAAYNEAVGTELLWSAAMLDIQRACRSPDIRVYPEVENAFFSPFSKSDTTTFGQMALAQIFGSDGLLLDLNSMAGNSVNAEPFVGALLDAARPALDWLADRFDPTLQTHGVGIPWRPDAAARIRTVQGDSMTELQASPFSPARVLGAFGISFQMRPGRVNALWGPLASAFDDAEVEAFLNGGAWLDAEAADSLIQRGFGELIGIESLTWHEREQSDYSIERIASVDTGAPPGFCLNANGFARAAILHPTGRAQTWTEWLNARGDVLGTCLSVHTNRRGGVVAVTGQNLAREENSLFKNLQRQTMAQRVVARLSGNTPPLMVTGGAYLMCLDLRRPDAGDRRLVVWNLSHDLVRPTIHTNDTSPREATRIRPLSPCEPATVLSNGAGVLQMAEPLGYYGLTVLCS
jgi:hypothetical protein